MVAVLEDGEVHTAARRAIGIDEFSLHGGQYVVVQSPLHDEKWWQCDLFTAIRENGETRGGIELCVRAQVLISLAEASQRLGAICHFDEKARKVTDASGKEIAIPSYEPGTWMGHNLASAQAELAARTPAGAFYLIVQLPVDDPEVSVEPLFAEDLLLLVHTRHPLSVHDEIQLADLAQVPLMLPPLGTTLRRVIDRAAAGSGIELVPQVEIDGVRLLASLAFEGFGAAIVPATSVPRWLKGDFKRIAVPELPRRVVAWVQRRRPAPSAPTRVAKEMTVAILDRIGHKQPGVHVGVESPARG